MTRYNGTVAITDIQTVKEDVQRRSHLGTVTHSKYRWGGGGGRGDASGGGKGGEQTRLS